MNNNNYWDNVIPTKGHLQIIEYKDNIRTVVYDKQNTIMVNAKEVLAMALLSGSDTDRSTTTCNVSITDHTAQYIKATVDNISLFDIGGFITITDTTYYNGTFPIYDITGNDVIYVHDFTANESGTGANNLLSGVTSTLHNSRISSLVLNNGASSTSDIPMSNTTLPGTILKTITPKWQPTRDAVIDTHTGYHAELLNDVTDTFVDKVRFTFAVDVDSANHSTPTTPVYYNSFGLQTSSINGSTGKLFAGKWLRGDGESTTFTSIVDDGSGFAELDCSDISGFNVGDTIELYDCTDNSYNGTGSITDITGNNITTDITYTADSLGFIKVINAVINIQKDNTRALEITWTIQF